jgi:hypothetical protein
VLCYWGFHTGKGLIARLGLGIGVPLVVAVIWGVFLAPRSGMRLTGIGYIILQVVIFGMAVAALYTTDHPKLAWAFAAIAVLNAGLMAAWDQ